MRRAASCSRLAPTLALIGGLFLSGIAPGASAQSPEITGTLKKIRDTGVIALGHRAESAPFSFVNAEGRPDGYSVDLCLRVADSIKETLQLPKLQVKWVPVTSADRIDQVTSGKVDLECGTTSATLSRQASVDFSNLIFVDGTGLLVRNDRNVRRIADLANGTVAVTAGTTTEAALRQAFAQRAITATVVTVKNELEGLAAVEAGHFDAYANDRLILIGVARKAKDLNALSLVDEDASMEPYALMMRHDPSFRLAVNRSLSALYRSPGIGEIYDRWFGGFGQPGPLLAAMYYLNATPE